jgi:hypothetical protein
MRWLRLKKSDGLTPNWNRPIVGEDRVISLRGLDRFLVCDQLLFDLQILLTYSLGQANSNCPNKQMGHLDQPVEISHENLHLGHTKHWNNEGKDHCHGSQNSELPGEYGNHTRGQKCKSDQYTKEHMKLKKAHTKKPVQQSKGDGSYPGKGPVHFRICINIDIQNSFFTALEKYRSEIPLYLPAM